MKIALVTQEYWPFIYGGRGVSTTLLVRQLRKRGMSVDVYVFQTEHSPIIGEMGTTKYYDVKSSTFWPLVNFHVIKALRKKLADYDLVHVYSGEPGIMPAVGFLRRTMLKTPVIATLNVFTAACIYHKKWMESKCTSCTVSDAMLCAFRRSKETETIFVPGPVLATYFIIQRSFTKNLDRYIALSDVIKKMYLSARFREDKITVIPNMYDPAFLENFEQARAEKSNDKITILYVGRLTKEKGVEDLVKAFVDMDSRKAELWIVGRGNEERKLRELANKAEKESKIRFYGFIRYSHVPPIYKKADIFVHPGKWPEPFCRTAMEAMLARLPIVASDSGALPGILGDSGLIYRTGDVSELKKVLETLVDSKKLRENLGQKAYNKCIKEYSADVITDRILKEYRNLIS